MKKFRFCVAAVFLLASTFCVASDLEPLAKQYYQAWVETQRPNATEENLQKYLALLTSDVGHQHLPYDPDDTREPDNKQRMLEGMNYYLGAHKKYFSKLDSVVTGHNLIVIKYTTKSEGVHPQTKEVVKQEYNTVEVLEIENGKVAVIRKYSD